MLIKKMMIIIDHHVDHHVVHDDADHHHVDHDAGQLQCYCSVCRWVGSRRYEASSTSGRYEASTKTKEDFVSFVKNSASKCGRPCENMPPLN